MQQPVQTVEGGGLSSPATSIPSQENIGDVDTPPHTPVSSATGSTQPTPQIQWATPLTDASADSEGLPR
jgi:hypothetical protein